MSTKWKPKEKPPGTRYMGLGGRWFIVLDDGRHVEWRRAA